jgi:hypothetical protein
MQIPLLLFPLATLMVDNNLSIRKEIEEITYVD